MNLKCDICKKRFKGQSQTCSMSCRWARNNQYIKGHDPVDGQACIYVLEDSEGIPFYIGCTTKSLKTRLSNHRCNKVGANITKCPFIRAIDYVKVEDRFECEAEWIKNYLQKGYDLINIQIR